MFRESAGIKKTVDRIAIIPVLIYLVVAVILTIVTAVSLYHAGELTVRMLITDDYGIGIQLVFIALFQTITAIVLFETTIVFFRTKHLAVQTLLVAGLTETIRHILIYDVGTMGAEHLIALGVLIGILIAGIYLMKPQKGWSNGVEDGE